MSLTALCSYFFWKKIAKTIIYLLTLSQNHLERQKYGTTLYNLVNFTMHFHIFGEKVHLKSQKNCIFCLKGDFEPQYFNLRTIKNLVNFSIKNVLKISPKLRLSVLINFVLIKKKRVSQTLKHSRIFHVMKYGRTMVQTWAAL